MKLENISEGLIIKNYKEFCELVGESVTTGNAKKSQTKEWECYLKFYNEGHKFIIEEIYENTLDKIDHRRDGNYSIYGDYVKSLIMNLLLENSKTRNGRVLSFSANSLLRLLEMINDNYAYCKRNIPNFSKYIKIDKEYIYEFFERSHSNLQGALETALNQLQREVLIMWSKELMVCTEYRSRKNQQVYQKYRNATDAEKEVILQCKDTVLKNFGYKSEGVVIASRQWESYSAKVNSLVHKKLNIQYFYNAYKLVINRDKVIDEYESILAEWKMNNIQKTIAEDTLNKLIIDNFNMNAEKRQVKAENTIIDYNHDHVAFVERQIMRMQDDYLETQNKLIHTLIDRKHNCIVNDIKKLSTYDEG